MWKKGIGKIIENNQTNLKPEYDLISEKLEKFYTKHFFEIKNQRDLSVHYDKESMKVYNMLTNLSSNELVLKTMPFIKLLNKLLTFTEKLVKELSEITTKKNKESTLKINQTLKKTEQMVKENNLNIDVSLLKNIVSKLK